MEWGEPDWQCNWLTARKARSVVDGQIHGGGSVKLDPVIEVAIRNLSVRVNHSNGLVGVYDKRDAVETLQVLQKLISTNAMCVNGVRLPPADALRSG